MSKKIERIEEVEEVETVEEETGFKNPLKNKKVSAIGEKVGTTGKKIGKIIGVGALATGAAVLGYVVGKRKTDEPIDADYYEIEDQENQETYAIEEPVE